MFRTRATERHSQIVAALVTLSISISLVPASAGAAGSAAKTAPAGAERTLPSGAVKARKAGKEQRQLRQAAQQKALTLRLSSETASLKQKTHHWQAVMRITQSRPVPAPPKTSKLEKAQFRYRVWSKRAATTWQRYSHPPNRENWNCIQRHETAPPFPAWRTRSGNGYYGGVQMDMTFQRTHGEYLLEKKGTADHWTVLEQIWVAEHGREVQGWGAWPNTSRMCGLRY